MLAVEVGQVSSLTLVINVYVGINLIGWILHHYGFHKPSIPLDQSGPSSETPSSFNSQSVLRFAWLYIKRKLFCHPLNYGGDVSLLGSVKYSSLGKKGFSKMICQLKYIFMWIFFIPEPTGIVFMWNFVPIFSVFTFFFRIRTRSIHLDRFIMIHHNVLYLGDFYFDSSRLKCLLNCIRCFNSKSSESCSSFDEIVRMDCCNITAI